MTARTLMAAALSGAAVCLAGLSAIATEVSPAGCPPPVITAQPADVTVEECGCAIFTVAATGAAPISYQWQLNSGDIPGANSASYTNCPVSLADDGNAYRVIVTDGCSSVTSQVARLHVVLDTTPPRIVSATAECNSNKVTVTFNEPVDPATAGEVFNYTLATGEAFTNAQVSADGLTVCLFRDSPFLADSNESLLAMNITDVCGGNTMTPVDVPILVRCRCLEVTEERVDADPAAPGVSQYSFTLQNLSTNAVKYLFLVPKTNCFSFSPAIVELNPPLLPGQLRNISVALQSTADCGTNLCFLLAAHDADFVECCSIMHCVMVPPPCPVPGPLMIVRSGARITITWDCGVLECAPEVIGPWNDVSGAASPYPVTATDARKFYRLRR